MQATPRTATLVDALLPGRGLLRDAALVVGFSVLVALFAQIAVRLPFTPVPITGQTLAVLLAGGALGANRGAVSLALYAFWGVIGLPVYAPGAAALEGELVHFILPWEGTGGPFWLLASGGYIAGFIPAAYVVGRLAERGWDRGWNAAVAMLIGNVILYAPGLLWLGYVISTGVLDGHLDLELAAAIPGANTLDKTLTGGLYPFILGDLAKLYIASVALPGVWALLGRRDARSGEGP